MKNFSESMIPVSVSKCQSNSWKRELKLAFSSVDELLDYVELDRTKLMQKVDLSGEFALRVPQNYVDKMEKGNEFDPLLMQVLPLQQENYVSSSFIKDPLKEQHSSNNGVIHKYHGRVLLMLSGACAVNCRYCFRRHFPYSEHRLNGEAQKQAMEYIENNSSITEVILSGGDPLMLQDDAIAALLDKLETIPHIKRLRIHTRLPVVIPSRLTLALAQRLSTSRFKTSMVLHINHANEIDAILAQGLKVYSTLGVTLLNQSVLLNNVNDAVDTLINLSEKLYEVGILPYYLHLLDPVEGAAHFDVDKELAIQLNKEMANRLPGYLVPKLVQEIAHQPAKKLIF